MTSTSRRLSAGMIGVRATGRRSVTTPRVSIGLPVHNGGRFIAEALESIRAQTYTNFELIVSDNASADRTMQICQAYAARDKRIFYSGTDMNLGAARNFNRAFRLSRGEYFKWAAADDVLEPTFLQRCVQLLDEDPTIVLAYTRVTNFDEQDVLREGTFRYDLADLRTPRPHDRLRQMFLYASIYPIFGLIRSSVLRRTPLFRAHIGADDCLLVDLVLRGKFGEVPERLLRLRARPGGYTSDLTWLRRSGGREGAAQARWWDPESKARVVLPYWRRLWEHFGTTARANVALDQKLLISAFLCRIANWWRPQLIRELQEAVRQHLCGPLRSVFRTAPSSRATSAPQSRQPGLKRVDDRRVRRFTRAPRARMNRCLVAAVRATPAPSDLRSCTAGPVLIVTPWYSPAIGGVARVAERLRDGLGQAHVPTRLMVCDGMIARSRLERQPPENNVWRFQIPSGAFYRLGFKSVAGTTARGLFTFVHLRRFVQTQNIRTVVLIYPCGYEWPFLLLRRAAGLRLIASYHGSEMRQHHSQTAPWRWLARRTLRSSDAITVCDEALGRKVQGLLPGVPLPIWLIPNGVDIDHFSRPPTFRRSDPRPTLVHVSNFAAAKRTLDIIKAFAMAAIPSASRLVMVGAGPDLPQAVERVRELRLQHRVEFVGAVDDVRPYLWGADLFVMASDEESCPLALLEAMACGLPWISTACGVAASLPAGECGLLVPPRSPRKLAAAVAELMADPRLRNLMGLRAGRRARSDFQNEDYVQRHLELIRIVQSGDAIPAGVTACDQPVHVRLGMACK